tara:strand:+ start:10353 stop:10994 length:642 start_codon:yes stop_codon:yes gene_type:complete
MSTIKTHKSTVKHTTFTILVDKTTSRWLSDGRPQDRLTNIEHKTFTRQDIHKAIWVAQGNDIETYVVRQGNYATAIKSWIDDEGLLERVSRGVYRLSDNGYKFGYRSYEEGVKLIRSINEEKAKKDTERARERSNQPHIKHAKNFQYLVGLRIIEVRYATPQEVKDMGWYSAPIVIQLSDGTVMYPQSDDEGNDGGALSLLNDNKNPDLAYTI